jgi:leucyl/phenylalanyl-tRNA---protein transferase
VPDFTLDDLIGAYAKGVFPMADSRDDETLFLVDPPLRGILPLDQFHVPARLVRTVRQDIYEVRVDTAFSELMGMCAQAVVNRPTTWISHPIQYLFEAMFGRGLAHSVEVWRNDTLMGGLYGVALGGVFFGESMVSRARDVSKIALVHLVARLKAGHYTLLDCQFMTQHLKQFGTIEIKAADYRRRLAASLAVSGDFYSLPGRTKGIEALTTLGL